MASNLPHMGRQKNPLNSPQSPKQSVPPPFSSDLISVLLLWEFTALQPHSLSYCLSNTRGIPLQASERDRPFACNVIPSREPPGTLPHLHGSTQALHLSFKEAFLAPLPKLLSKLFPIVCVSLSCFLSPSPYILSIYTHTDRQTDTPLYIHVHTKYIIQYMCINVKFTLLIICPQYIKCQ